MRSLLLVCAALLLPATAAAQDLIVNNFEGDAPPAALRPVNLTATPVSDSPAEGRAYVQLKPSVAQPSRAHLRLMLRAKAHPAGRRQLSASLRAPESKEAIQLRWLAFDDDDRAVFQRRFQLPPGEKWVRIDQPLRAWRWDNQRIGDWDEVRSVALVIDSPGVTRVDLDDVRFAGTATEKEHAAWLLDLAFADRPRKHVHADGLLVATDALDAFTPQDLQYLLDNMRRTRAFIRRVFGDSARPTDDHAAPAALILFADERDYPVFFDRLGDALRVEIGAPSSQGYTVQDIAASTFDPELGPRRPVYFHESVHAVVARELRLLTGHPPHRPLQEGIANYLQVCLYPSSLPRSAYARNFAKPIDPAGVGFFKPLEMLFAKPVTTSQYAQLASVIAYLIEKDPKLLRALSLGLCEGKTATEIVRDAGKSWRDVETGWLTWGRQRFAPGHSDQSSFDTPPEWSEVDLPR